MEKRLQVTADDTVLEIVEDKPVKRRLSKKALLRNKAYLQQSIATFQATFAEVEAQLKLITDEENAKENSN